MLFFEDLKVGSSVTYGGYRVTQEEVIEFASRYDPQPFHLSDDAAAGTYFGRLAASGWHTAAMTMAMTVAYWRDHPQAGLGSPGLDELRWLKPVYPGDILRCEAMLLDKRLSASRLGMGITKSRTIVINQHDDVVMTFIANGLIRTRADY